MEASLDSPTSNTDEREELADDGKPRKRASQENTMASYSQTEEFAKMGSTTPGFAIKDRQDLDAATKKSPKTKKGGRGEVLLPENFKPTPYSVIIGRGKESKDHAIGNQRLRVLVSQHLEQYANAKNRTSMSKIVSSVISTVRAACGPDTHGAFVKLGKERRWYEVSEAVAREKVGYTFRDMLGHRYRSSSKFKVARKRQLRGEAIDHQDASMPEPQLDRTNQEVFSHSTAQSSSIPLHSPHAWHQKAAGLRQQDTQPMLSQYSTLDMNTGDIANALRDSQSTPVYSSSIMSNAMSPRQTTSLEKPVPFPEASPCSNLQLSQLPLPSPFPLNPHRQMGETIFKNDEATDQPLDQSNERTQDLEDDDCRQS